MTSPRITGHVVDTNGRIAALLRDVGSVQKERVSRWGYVGAAAAVFGLDQPIESLVFPKGSLSKIAHVGPKSEAIILEVLRTGSSPTAERKIAESGKAGEVETMRTLRDKYFSRAQVVSILNDPELSGVGVHDYRGDFQMHSTYSDGTQSLEDIFKTGIDRGYEYSAISDHSHGLKIARGMSMSELADQHRNIDALNAKYRGKFRMIKGIEANINAEGGLDMSREELQQLEMVLAAPHSALRNDADQTARMVSAVRTPGVHVLAHPRGRHYGKRGGIIVDWNEVCAVAADANVAIELDGDPSRQDLDYEITSRVLPTGCLFALDSDAHATDELRYAENAIAHARLAGVPAERVINCWPLDRLMDWLKDR
jgi:histidinol phosphatase-like PHP family hydrolase